MIFRYPGAKSKSLSILENYLQPSLETATGFHDVFVGSGALLLHLARKYPRLELHANDLDPDMADFWRVVISDEADDLCQRLRIKATIDTFYEVRAQKPTNRVGRAFRVLFLNRTCFSGLIHSAPIGGAAQLSPWKVFSLYDSNRLAKEIQEAHRLLKGRTDVTSIDGAEYAATHPAEVKYLDPPYFMRGDFHYRQRMTFTDHIRLAATLKTSTNWVLSYDNCPSINALYSWANRRPHTVLYRMTKPQGKCLYGRELLIIPPRGITRIRETARETGVPRAVDLRKGIARGEEFSSFAPIDQS